MPKTRECFTKYKVLAEVKELRRKIMDYRNLGTEQLRDAFRQRFPGDADTILLCREGLINSLVMSDTFHLTNVLNLE